jgi:hypothetical protein
MFWYFFNRIGMNYMEVKVQELTTIINAVGYAAIVRKELLDEEYKKAVGDDFVIPLNWYRTRKNADLKDALTLEGIKRGFSVRAEKVMGHFPSLVRLKIRRNSTVLI